MTTRRLKIGDCVRLKCGGPMMIVTDDENRTIHRVMWFNNRNDLCDAEIETECLDYVEPIGPAGRGYVGGPKGISGDPASDK